jgi:type I site-specific restriction endonuclease
MGVHEEGQAIVTKKWQESVDRALEEHMERLDKGDDRFDSLEQAINSNTEITQRVETNTKAVVTWVNNVTGFKNVVDWLGELALKFAAVLAAVTVLWYAVSTGHLPAKVEASPGKAPAVSVPQ